MAIQKDKLTKSGVVANYWRVRLASFNADTMCIKVTISLYLNKEARLAGKGAFPSYDKEYSFVIENSQLNNNLQALAYSLIKQKAASLVANLDGNGSHPFDADLADGVDV